MYLKMNDLFVSENNDLVALSRDISKAIPIIIQPKIDAYNGIQVTNFDKFNMIGLFDDISLVKYLKRRESDHLYTWDNVYQQNSFRASNHVDYTNIICGCTNPIALNYNPLATENNNSCAISGCMDPYNSLFNC